MLVMFKSSRTKSGRIFLHISKAFLAVDVICFQRTWIAYKELKYIDIYQVPASFGEGEFT